MLAGKGDFRKPSLKRLTPFSSSPLGERERERERERDRPLSATTASLLLSLERERERDRERDLFSCSRHELNHSSSSRGGKAKKRREYNEGLFTLRRSSRPLDLDLERDPLLFCRITRLSEQVVLMECGRLHHALKTCLALVFLGA